MKSPQLGEVVLRHGAFADGLRPTKRFKTHTRARASIKEEQDVIIIGAGTPLFDECFFEVLCSIASIANLAGRSKSGPKE